MADKYVFDCEIKGGKVYGKATLRSFHVSGGKMPKDKKYVVPEGRQVDFGGVDLKEVFAYAMDFWLIKVGKLRQSKVDFVEDALDQQVFTWGFAADPKVTETEEDKVRDTVGLLVGGMEQNKLADKTILNIVNTTYSMTFETKEALDKYINADGGDNAPDKPAVWEDIKKSNESK
jgi:hypothetical protein